MFEYTNSLKHMIVVKPLLVIGDLNKFDTQIKLAIVSTWRIQANNNSQIESDNDRLPATRENH